MKKESWVKIECEKSFSGNHTSAYDIIKSDDKQCIKIQANMIF